MSNCFVINAAAHLQPSCSSLASENNPLISLDWWIDPQIWWESNKELSVGWFKEYLKEITMGNYQWVTTVSDVILPTSVLSCEFLLKPKKQDNAGAWATSTKYACRLGSGRYGSWNCVSKFDVMYLFVPVPMTTNGWPQKKNWECYAGVDIFVQGSWWRRSSTQKSMEIGEYSLLLHGALFIQWHKGTMGSHVILIIPCVIMQIDHTKPDQTMQVARKC